MGNIRALLVLAVFSGCSSVTTELTSFKDRAFTGEHFSKILVSTDLTDLTWRTKAEEIFCSKLKENRADGIGWSTLFLPTRTYTDADVTAALEREKVDARLSLTAVSSGMEGSYVWIYPSGFVYVRRPWWKFDVKLDSTSLGKTVWMCSAQCNGDGAPSVDKIFESLARASIEQMSKEDVFPPPLPPKPAPQPTKAARVPVGRQGNM